MSPREFSYMSLELKDKEENQLHWQYKLKVIRKTMYLYALCIPCCLFFTTGIFVFGRTLASAIPVFCNLAFAALFILTYIVSKKSDNFVYLVPISRLLITALYLYLTSGTSLDSS